MSSDSENELFGDDAPTSPPQNAPSPGGASADEGGRSDDDDDGEAARAADDGPGDIFGSDDDDDNNNDNDNANNARRAQRDSRSPSTPPSSPGGNRLEYAEEDVEETHEVVADVPIPTWSRLRPTDGKVWHLKLPAYVNVEARPFEKEYYRAVNEDDGEHLTGPAAKGKMIGVRNTMRWRWTRGPDGEPVRQSNARMLRWSDGSVSLQLGSDVFDLAPSYGTTLARPQDDAPPKKDVASGSGSGGAEQTFLCVTAPNEQVLVTEAAIAGQLSLVPTSMDSKTHRELVSHVGQQHVKHSRMKILDDIGDSDKVAELLARAAPQRAVAKPTSTTRTSRPRAAADSLGGRRGGRFQRAGSDDSDGYGSRERRAARDRERDYDEDDGFVVADSDEDSDDGGARRGGGSSSKKGKRRARDASVDEDLDPMELAERQIEQAERERKRHKSGKKSSSSSSKRRAKDYDTTDEEDAEGEAEEEEEADDDEPDLDMDVESEEE